MHEKFTFGTEEAPWNAQLKTVLSVCVCVGGGGQMWGGGGEGGY